MKMNWLKWLLVLAGMSLVALGLLRGMGSWQTALMSMDSGLRLGIGLIIGVAFFLYVYWQQRKNKPKQ